MILERIKEYIDSKGISVAAFERSIGMSNASFGKSLRSKGAIGTDKLENILSVYKDLSAEWLMTGRGEMLKTKHSVEPSSPNNEVPLENKNSNDEPIKQESPISILLAIIREKDDKLQEQAEEIGRLRERITQLECIKESKERVASAARSSGLADVG